MSEKKHIDIAQEVTKCFRNIQIENTTLDDYILY